MEYKRTKEFLGHKPSSTEFLKFSNITHRKLTEVFGRNSFSKLTEECGEIPNIFSYEKSKLENIFQQYATLVSELRELPISAEWDNAKLKPTTNGILKVHGIKWIDMPNKFLEFAQKCESDEWKVVLALIPTNVKSEANIENISSGECYVYLMLDTKTNFHKIVISNKAEYREKTLQSEKPSIKLIAKKKYINRRIAANFEKALHDSYSHKRKRGEWFLLDEGDIYELKATLDD